MGDMLVLGRGIFWAQDTAELFERRGSYIEVQTPKMPSQQQDFRLVDPELKLLFAPVAASHNMYIYIYTSSYTGIICISQKDPVLSHVAEDLPIDRYLI